jgi:GNAT superfamily N-acetyltransferase
VALQGRPDLLAVLGAATRVGERHDGQVDEADASPGLPVQVNRVQPGKAGFELALALAARMLAQDRYPDLAFPDAPESGVPGAHDGARCAGFLRFVIQVPGAEAGRPVVPCNGTSLEECRAGAFGVDPQLRRRGIGTALRQHVGQQCRIAGCCQCDPAAW